MAKVVTDLTADDFKKIADEKVKTIIDLELETIYNEIDIAAKNGKYSTVLDLEEYSNILQFVADIRQHLLDRKFDVSYNSDNLTLKISW